MVASLAQVFRSSGSWASTRWAMPFPQWAWPLGHAKLPMAPGPRVPMGICHWAPPVVRHRDRVTATGSRHGRSATGRHCQPHGHCHIVMAPCQGGSRHRPAGPGRGPGLRQPPPPRSICRLQTRPQTAARRQVGGVNGPSREKHTGPCRQDAGNLSRGHSASWTYCSSSWCCNTAERSNCRWATTTAMSTRTERGVFACQYSVGRPIGRPLTP